MKGHEDHPEEADTILQYVTMCIVLTVSTMHIVTHCKCTFSNARSQQNASAHSNISACIANIARIEIRHNTRKAKEADARLVPVPDGVSGRDEGYDGRQRCAHTRDTRELPRRAREPRGIGSGKVLVLEDWLCLA